MAEPVTAHNHINNIDRNESTVTVRNRFSRLQPINAVISIAEATPLCATGASVARFRATLFLRDK
jgi:hypothetical protein